MHFESPWAFSLLLLIPVFLWLRRVMAGRGALRFSTVKNAAKAGKSIRQTLAPLTTVLQIVAIVCLIVALARPQTGREKVRDVSKGIAIEMVVDRSGSMGAEMEYKGRKMNRLEVVKKVFESFALGDGDDLAGRPNDLIGTISFARYADTICPLTLAHGALPQFLRSVKLVQSRDEDGTNIGDALALAAARLETADETLAKQNPGVKKSYKIKSKVIILLSDGENNCGKRDPVEAARTGKEMGHQGLHRGHRRRRGSAVDSDAVWRLQGSHGTTCRYHRSSADRENDRRFFPQGRRRRVVAGDLRGHRQNGKKRSRIRAVPWTIANRSSPLHWLRFSLQHAPLS